MWGFIELYPPYIGAPGGIRTHNRLIRSQMLYPLSYGGLSVHAYYTSSFTIEKTQIEEFLVFAVISIAFIAFRRLDEDNKSVD